MTRPTLRLLSLGAGVQSSPCLLLAAHGEISTFDAAVFESARTHSVNRRWAVGVLTPNDDGSASQAQPVCRTYRIAASTWRSVGGGVHCLVAFRCFGDQRPGELPQAFRAPLLDVAHESVEELLCQT